MCTEKQPYIPGEQQSKAPAPRIYYTVYNGRITVPPEIEFGKYIRKVAEDNSQVTYLKAPEGTAEQTYLISKRSSGKRGVVKSIKILDELNGQQLAVIIHRDGSFSYITPEKYQEILQQVKPLEGKIVRVEVPVIALTLPVQVPEKKEEPQPSLQPST